MDADRKCAITAGIVFIVATAGSLASAPFLPNLAAPSYLSALPAGASQLNLGVLLLLVAAFGSAAIAPAMYPVMRRSHSGLAIASVVFRTIEAVLYVVAAAFLLTLLTLGQQLASADAATLPALQAVGDTLRGAREHAGLLGVFAFCLGGLAYYWLFWVSKLVPRWLSGFGIVAIVLMFIACTLALYSGNPITSYVPLALPILVQEMVLAVWLIARGFNPTVAAN